MQLDKIKRFVHNLVKSSDDDVGSVIFWMRIVNIEAMKSIHSLWSQDWSNIGTNQMQTSKIEEMLFVSLISRTGHRMKALFDIGHAIGSDVHICLNFDNGCITEVFVNAEKVDYVQLGGCEETKPNL